MLLCHCTNRLQGIDALGRKTGPSLTIDTSCGAVFKCNPKTFAKWGEDRELQFFFGLASRKGPDENDEPLFERALKKLGILNHDMMYGCVPALALGGSPELENLQNLILMCI